LREQRDSNPRSSTQSHTSSGRIRHASQKSATTIKSDSRARDRLRKSYRPNPVRILFVGESPPASGRFFYQADSGLYRAVANTFATAFPSLSKREFLDAFRSLGCYLVDLCGQPVDHMTRHARECICHAGETRLARTIRELHPKALVTLVRSIGPNVRRAKDRAGWSGLYLELPYPGRWHHHRAEFARQLVPLLRKTVRLGSGKRGSL
jgi:hypothetical protein